MADLENGVLQRRCEEEAPIVYICANIFFVVKNVRTVYIYIYQLRQQFEQNSVLKLSMRLN